MPLTQEQINKIENAVQLKFPSRGPECPLCKHREWTYAPDLGLMVLQPGGFGSSSWLGYGVPGAVLTCAVCGFTMLLHLDTLGLNPKELE